MSDKLLRRPAVEARTGLSRSTLYDWMKRGELSICHWSDRAVEIPASEAAETFAELDVSSLNL